MPDPGTSPPSSVPPSVRRANMVRNAFFLLLGQVGTTVLAVVLNGTLTRGLGARDFGVYFLISSFSTFAYVVVDWGQQFYGVREVARSPERGGDLLGTGLVLRACGAALICLPAGVAAWLLGYEARTRWFTVAFILLNLPFLLAQLYGIVFRGRDRMNLDAIVSVVNKVVAVSLSITALSLGLRLGGVVLAQGAAGAVALATAAYLYRIHLRGPPLRFTWSTARESLAGGTSLATMGLAIYVQPYVDAVLLSKLSPPEVIGWYGAASAIMGTLYAPASILGAAAFPQLSRAAARGTPEDFAKVLQGALRPLFWLGGLTAVGTYLFAGTAIAVVCGRHRFEPAADVLRVFAGGVFLIFVDMLLGFALTALDRARAMSITKVASVVVSTALELAFIPYFQHHWGNGGVGVVFAFVLSEVLMFAGFAYLAPRGCLGWKVALDAVRALAAAATTAVLFRFAPHLSPWLGIPLCIVTFTLLSAATGLVKRADLEGLKSAARGRLARTPAARTP